MRLREKIYFLAVACLLIGIVIFYGCKDEVDVQPVETPVVEEELLIEPVVTPIVTEEPIVEPEPEPTPEPEPELISLGEFRLTAYCSCKKCCGRWANNRPKDENGNEIVYGSSGEVLIAGVSIAVDTDVIPYGTEVIINGNTYIAHDTGSGIDGNCIDVYHNSHEEAKEFAVQYAEVFVEVN